MSEQEQQVNESEEEQQERSQDQQDEEEQDQEQQAEQQEDQEQQEEEDNSQQQQQEEEGEEEQTEEVKQQKEEYKLPTFPKPSYNNENSLEAVLSQLGSLQNSVDNLIETFPSKKLMTYNRPSFDRSINQVQVIVPTKINLTQLQKSQTNLPIKYVRDTDTQVDLQPQIIIKSIQKSEQPIKNYTINSESEKFLYKFYEDGKKYKRWDRTSNLQEDKQINKFQRKDLEQGVFNIDERNREIDEAIRKLKEDM